jgi:hypothetical protein
MKTWRDLSDKQRKILFFVLYGLGTLFIVWFVYALVAPYVTPLSVEGEDERVEVSQVRTVDASSQIKINDYKFSVEIADSEQEVRRGLMFVEKLHENEGMLFKFSDYREGPFWMKNVLIDLDILFINSEGKVVDIQTMKPCKYKDSSKCKLYYPDKPYKYALEINGGAANKKGISIGDKAELP